MALSDTEMPAVAEKVITLVEHAFAFVLLIEISVRNFHEQLK